MTVNPPTKFSKTRSEHLREKGEDYVEMIQELLSQQGEARLTDLAHRFGVSTVTAHNIIERLQREGLITTKPYRALLLTGKGKRLALKSKKRHQTVYRVLKKIGVPERVAERDAEGMEHHVSPQTLSAFKRFLHLKEL